MSILTADSIAKSFVRSQTRSADRTNVRQGKPTKCTDDSGMEWVFRTSARLNQERRCMATLMLQMLPIVRGVAWVLFLRRPPVQAGFAGVALVFLLWILGAAAPLSAATTAAIFKDTSILFFSTACVIVP